jgi:nitroreductase
MTTLRMPDVVEQLRWRYAVKKFDAGRKIAASDWKALEEALVLAPSSYGLQPWRFLVVGDAGLRGKLREASWNQTQVTDASHYVVFASRVGLGAADVERFIARTAEVRGVPPSALDKYKELILGDVVRGPRAKWIDDWCARQAYIALGQFMAVAAVAGIDTCPMEGIDPSRYDELLGLRADGFQALCGCAAGFRAADDRTAAAPKVRYESGDVVRHV